MSKGKVLVIASNADRIEIRGGGWGPASHHLNDTVVPSMALIQAGYDIVLATPNGQKPHIDESSDQLDHFDGDEQAYRRAWAFFTSDVSMNRVGTLRSVLEAGVEVHAGVYVPGGLAPAVDLMQDNELGAILRYFHLCKKPTAFLGQSTVVTIASMSNAREFRAALVAGATMHATELARGWQYAGYRMTVISNAEARVAEDKALFGKLSFHLADALVVAGGDVDTSPAIFEPYVIEDRELLTGQNPQSDSRLTVKLIEALDRSARA